MPLFEAVEQNRPPGQEGTPWAGRDLLFPLPLDSLTCLSTQLLCHTIAVQSTQAKVGV